MRAGLYLILVLCLGLAALGFQSGGRAQDAANAAGAALYRTGNRSDHNLYALDAGKLTDMSADPAATIPGDFQPGSVVMSDDGATFAGLDGYGRVLIQNGLGGAIRSQFAPNGVFWPEKLSADGTKLLVSMLSNNSDEQPAWPDWKVFDTATGEAIDSIRTDPAGSAKFSMAIDPVAWKMYLLTPGKPGDIAAIAPQLAKLVVFDLTTGAELGQLNLLNVRIGSWTDPQASAFAANGEPVIDSMTPGIALSPDGHQIAIINANDFEITLVDAASLAVERYVFAQEKTGVFDWVLSHLPFIPQTASAKTPTIGTTVIASYAADGKHLFIGGNEIRLNQNATAPEQFGLGITVVNTNDGAIEGKAFEGFELSTVNALPNGDVYITGIDWLAASRSKPSYVIARLKSDSLEKLAVRSFPIFVWFYMTPAA